MSGTKKWQVRPFSISTHIHNNRVKHGERQCFSPSPHIMLTIHNKSNSIRQVQSGFILCPAKQWKAKLYLKDSKTNFCLIQILVCDYYHPQSLLKFSNQLSKRKWQFLSSPTLMKGKDMKGLAESIYSLKVNVEGDEGISKY